jgi:hypothetical protein
MRISPLLEGYFPEGSFVWLTFCYSVQYIHTVCGWEGVRGFEYCWVPYFVEV